MINFFRKIRKKPTDDTVPEASFESDYGIFDW